MESFRGYVPILFIVVIGWWSFYFEKSLQVSMCIYMNVYGSMMIMEKVNYSPIQSALSFWEKKPAKRNSERTNNRSALSK